MHAVREGFEPFTQVFIPRILRIFFDFYALRMHFFAGRIEREKGDVLARPGASFRISYRGASKAQEDTSRREKNGLWGLVRSARTGHLGFQPSPGARKTHSENRVGFSFLRLGPILGAEGLKEFDSANHRLSPLSLTGKGRSLRAVA